MKILKEAWEEISVARKDLRNRRRRCGIGTMDLWQDFFGRFWGMTRLSFFLLPDLGKIFRSGEEEK